MTPKHLFILLLALFASAVAQNDEELQIPVENDNQFPPVEPDDAIIDGSGAGAIDDPLESTTEARASIIEDIQLNNAFLDTTSSEGTEGERVCPTPCVCHIEGDTNKYIVDCSGYDLTELPKGLDAKTTELNLQDNKITEIPKDISELKNLKVLNVDNNEIMQIVSGSISELPELTTLKLSNNRLLEFPTDLKNSFGLTKLEELDLGNNDMRESLNPEMFSNFQSLRKLTLPKSAAVLAEDLCQVLKQSLETICTGTCSNKTFECQEAPVSQEDGLLDFVLPGLIALGTAANDETNEDPVIPSIPEVNKEAKEEASVVTTSETANKDTTRAVGDASIRSAIMKASDEDAKKTDVNAAVDDVTSKSETEKVGATTADTKTGGVDKSIIGLVVAGMVVIIAGITIKKNWSSIRNRFSSSPRPANDRTGVNANGTTPEEVPLQEKSPV